MLLLVIKIKNELGLLIVRSLLRLIKQKVSYNHNKDNQIIPFCCYSKFNFEKRARIIICRTLYNAPSSVESEKIRSFEKERDRERPYILDFSKGL